MYVNNNPMHTGFIMDPTEHYCGGKCRGGAIFANSSLLLQTSDSPPVLLLQVPCPPKTAFQGIFGAIAEEDEVGKSGSKGRNPFHLWKCFTGSKPICVHSHCMY